jgi:predicted MFS family arabinose efflux permease
MADRRFASCVVLFILMAAVLQQMTVTLPIDMSGAGLSQTACGAVLALNGVLICLFQVPAGGLLPRCPPFTMLALAAALIGIGFGLTAFADSAVAFAVTVVIWTAGEVISGPVSMEVTARFATATSQGRYQGVGAFAWTVGGTIASAVGGYAYDRFGSAMLWAGCLGTGLATACGFLWVGRDFRSRQAVAGQR